MMPTNAGKRGGSRTATILLGCTAGFLLGALTTQGSAGANPPSEHKGLTVEALGVIPASSMAATIGLDGHMLQLRAITIAPGGQIAEHSHATRPGLVKVISGEWVEGQPTGEAVFAAGDPDAILEDEDTTHWFFNHGDQPATAIVCDIVPES